MLRLWEKLYLNMISSNLSISGEKKRNEYLGPTLLKGTGQQDQWLQQSPQRTQIWGIFWLRFYSDNLNTIVLGGSSAPVSARSWLEMRKMENV